MARGSATRPDSIRRHNLNVLLAELRENGPLSRVELTHNLGLNRSTIGALVADLTECGLVTEHAPGTRAGAGRPSHVVAPRVDGPYAVAVDITVRQLKVAAVSLGGEVLARHTVEMAEFAPPADAVAAVVHGAEIVAKSVPAGSWPAGVGVSVAGTVGRRDGRVLVAPNLRWVDVDLIAGLRSELGATLPIRVGNDANLGVLAEHLRGVARGVDDVVYLLARVGVGAGILSDGVPLRGFRGLAGEIGHVIVEPNGPACYCGNRGCFERVVGERALFARAGMAGISDSDGAAQVARAAESGDARAEAAIEHVCGWLAVGLAGLSHLVNPQLIVIGGSFAALLASRCHQIQTALDQLMKSAPGDSAEICVGMLGADAPLLGAAEIAFADLLTDPVEAALTHRPLTASVR
jgi:predicted NBD/HSP70 family sugar kinase